MKNPLYVLIRTITVLSLLLVPALFGWAIWAHRESLSEHLSQTAVLLVWTGYLSWFVGFFMDETDD